MDRQEIEVGDLVSYHYSSKARRRTGLVLEAIRGGWVRVYWFDLNRIYKHVNRFDLRKLS